MAEVGWHRAAARRLRIPVGDPVLTFTRVRLADELPMVVERTTLPGSYVPGLEADDLNGSLYELLTNRYGIFEYTSAVYRGDRYAFTAELRMTPTLRANSQGL